MMSTQTAPAGARRLTLRALTLNVAGRLHDSATQAALAELLVGEDVDVVFLQEVRCSGSGAAHLAHAINQAVLECALQQQRRHHSGFDFAAGPNNNNNSSGGTLLLWRRALVAAGALQLAPHQPQPSWDGRLQSLNANWGGFHLQFVNVYAPNDPVSRQLFISSAVATAWSGNPTASIAMGDWNFVEDPNCDRRWRNGRPQAADPNHDNRSKAAMQVAAPGAVDAYKQLHPSRRAYTFFHTGNGHAARLDRAYVGAALTQAVLHCTPLPSSISDHHPLLLELRPRQVAANQGPGLHRARMDFMSSDLHAQHFTQWLRCEVANAPEDPAALLQWWPGFKRRAYSAAKDEARLWRQEVPSLAARFTAAKHQVAASVQQLEQATTQNEVNEAMAAVAAAKASLHAQQAEVWSTAARLQRHTWLQQGERPQPVITQQLRALEKGPAKSAIVALRSAADGRLVWAGAEPANIAIAHWAAVSAAPATDPAALAEVLAAVRQLPSQPADADGSANIADAEIHAAMSASRPGAAPGPDGLPLLFYKKCGQVILPLLARMFSAIGSLHVVPGGFLDGIIVGIFKAGDPTLAVNYRPITLLNCDYRLLARVLGDRLQVVLKGAISPTQTAFVKGRRIGANIITLQLLMHCLPPSSEAAAVLLDIAKAYDTVDRGFLLQVLEAMGVGDAYKGWVQLLLSSTFARACFNGFLSRCMEFRAGVRQGCPLSPLLYLFVGEALLRWLQAKNIGISVHGVNLTATQFADDTQVYLMSQAEAPAFLAAMSRFGAASGQQLSLGKTKLLLVGKAAREHHLQRQLRQQWQRHRRNGSQQVPTQPPQPQQLQQHPLMVVLEAKVLGVWIGCTDASWLQQRMDGVIAALARLSHVKQLSAFGRGLGSAAYGVSKMLYAAEFCDLPSAAQCNRLALAVAAVVDRGASPTAPGRSFHGIKACMLAGPPGLGGFGALPWQEHILARHAWWGARLIAAEPDDTTPWIALCRAVLAGTDFKSPLGLLDAPEAQSCLLPPPLTRMVAGLQAIGPVKDLHAQLPVTVGPWCADAPLFYNVCLTVPGALAEAGRPRGMQTFSSRTHGIRCVRGLLYSLGDLVRALRVLRIRSQAPDPSVGPWADATDELADLQLLQAALPSTWMSAATAATPATPNCLESYLQSSGLQAMPLRLALTDAEHQACFEVVQRLGWRDASGHDIPIAHLTVKAATRLQLTPLHDRQYEHRLDLAACAVGDNNPAQLHALAQSIASAQRSLWRLHWDNHFKEIFWRLVLDGLATAARLHMDQQPCICRQAQCPDRRHHFWDCPVAQAVVASMGAQLVGSHALHPPARLTPRHVMLMRPPDTHSGPLHQGVWQVVCLAAINAMDLGRSATAKWHVQQRQQQQPMPAAAVPLDQRLITTFFARQPPSAAELQRRQARQQQTEQQLQHHQLEQQQQQLGAACAAAVARFWELLADFEAVATPPAAWLNPHDAACLPLQHPFFHSVETGGTQRCLGMTARRV